MYCIIWRGPACSITGSKFARWCCRTSSSTTTARRPNTTRPGSTPATSSRRRWARSVVKSSTSRRGPEASGGARRPIQAISGGGGKGTSRSAFDAAGIGRKPVAGPGHDPRRLVFAGERRVAKPGELLAADTVLAVRGRDHPWVSRGGVKLAHALAHFSLNPAGAVALDIGAATGGFTDVLLAHGARRVYAVDVGHGQLAWRLRGDPRVIVLERTNARYLTRAQIPEPVDFIVCDASFIGLATVLPTPLAFAAPAAVLVALIKPQFEAGPEQVGKGGVVRDPAVHRAVCARVAGWLAQQPGWRVRGVVESPIRGPEGNREFLICARHDHTGE